MAQPSVTTHKINLQPLISKSDELNCK